MHNTKDQCGSTICDSLCYLSQKASKKLASKKLASKKLAFNKQICLSHKNWLTYIYKSGSNGI